MTAAELADAFVASGGVGDRETLPLRLHAWMQRVDAALPGVAVPHAALVRRLAQHTGAEGLDALEDEGVIELALACACAEADPRALAIVEARYMSAVAPALASMGLDRATIDDVAQTVRDKLLVADGPDAEIKLLRYAGRGTLHGLVKVTAVRTALSLLRDRRGGGQPDDDLERLAEPADDPELHFLKARYREAFRRAFARAVAELDGRERNVLRLHHIGAMTLEQVARMYGIDRSTVVRLLQKVRGKLFTRTRAALREDLAIERTELDDVLALIRSRFEVSLGRLLETVRPPDP
jgi:RNA polymerase sigma-70 factor (ECF subfamily)